MTNKYSSTALAVLCSASLALNSSCRKGPEDPFISFKKRETRLAGTWKEKIIFTTNFPTHIEFHISEMNFEEDGDASFIYKTRTNNNGKILETAYSVKGKWAFNEKKDVINFSNLNLNETGSFDYKVSFNVTGLSSDQLHIDGDFSADNIKYGIDWKASKQ